jgi:hypothetical protein
MGSCLITRTIDADFIKTFVTESDVFDEISEDNFSRDEWNPDMNSGWFVHTEDDEVCGIWMAELRNGITVEIHPMILPNAKMFAIQCGMKAEGKIRKSFKKDGKIHDQWLLGITREELEARYE